VSAHNAGPPGEGGGPDTPTGPNRPTYYTDDHQAPPRRPTADGNAPGRREPGEALRWVPCTWAHPQDLHARLRRRRVAASRSVPLDCGCRDPHACRCTQPPPSAVMVAAGAAAAAHLLKHGLPPLLDIDTARALWRRSPADRALVTRLNDYGLAR